MVTHIKETAVPQNTTLDDFILEAEALVAKARRLNIAMVAGIDTPDKVFLTASTPKEITSDDIFLLITNLAPRHYPSVLTMSPAQYLLHRLEEDTANLKASDIPFVVGVQTDPQDKLKILQHLPDGARSSLHSAHFDLTMYATMERDEEEEPC